MSHKESSRRAKKYEIDVEGLQRVSALGAIDPDTGMRSQWEPAPAVEFLVDLQLGHEFDVERYCGRCEQYDGELAIYPHQLELPRLRPEALRRMKLDPVALPWQPGKPSSDAHPRTEHKSRPGRPVNLNACHMCLISFYDEVPLPKLTPAEEEALKAPARAARDEVFRLRKASSNPANAPELAAYIVKLQEAADRKLRAALAACRAAGVQPWKFGARRSGDDAPDQVVSTTWVRPEESR